MKYKYIIGLETHIELKTKQKMFCGCLNSLETGPNTNVCPVCLGMPGALPVPNEQAIRSTILIGLALNCKINLQSFFERKHYFYPDLAKGYQISQYEKPLCYDGKLEVDGKIIKINRVHLEEDTGKLLHGQQFNDSNSYIDFNRSGVPLVEIVTEPDIESSDIAGAYLRKLQLIVRYLNVSDCDMEKGSMRCEPNISQIREDVFLKTKKLPNYKVEVKNINSFKFVQKAISYEQQRHTALLDQNITPKQETRRYVESSSKTESMRSKEYAQDYRYFPEPDIPPLDFEENYLEEIKKHLKTIELPDKRDEVLTKKYGLSADFATQMVQDKALGDKYLELVKLNHNFDLKKLANLLINKKLNINAKNADIIKQAEKLVKKTVVDESILEAVVNKVLNDNKDAVNDYKKGKTTAIQFLIGQCFKTLGNSSQSEDIRALLLKKLVLS